MFDDYWMRGMADFCLYRLCISHLPARLAQQIGQGETSLRSARNLAVLYDSNVFALLVCNNHYLYAKEKPLLDHT